MSTTTDFDPLAELKARVPSGGNLRAKLTAVFETVYGQIQADIQAAKSKGSAAEAAGVFEQHAHKYRQQREQIIAALADDDEA